MILNDTNDKEFTISYTDYGIGGPYHAHAVDELVIVLAGVSRILTQDSTYRVNGSFVIFNPAGMPHEQINDMNYEYRRYCINFKPCFIEDIIDIDKIPRSFCVFNIDDTEAARFEKYLELMYRDDGDSRIMYTRRKYLLALIFCELEPIMKERLPIVDRRQVSCTQLVHDICFYINENCHEQLTLDSVARQFYISRSKLVRLLRSELGMTPNGYITLARLSRAKRLLRSGLTVHEAAEQSGFSSPGYFIKLFRRQTGVTPAKYKEHITNDEYY